MNEDEEILFQQEMSGVEPLPAEARISLKRPEASADSTAPRPQQGGTGAVYVLLRKSEQAKQRNRERFRPGSV